MQLDLSRFSPAERSTLQLRVLYEGAGYRKFRCSHFEEYSLYQQNERFLSDSQVITFTDLDGKLRAIKPDVTLSIAKNAQPAAGECKKYYYTEQICRPSRESHTFSEISQMGLECIGAVGAAEQAEVVRLALESPARLEVPTVLEVSHMGFVTALLDTLQKHSIDVVVLAGFLSVLGEKVIAAYRNKIINVHPSLIPSFCGPGFYGLRVHEAALARGVKLTGATVHLVNEECDGGPILLQKAVAVEPGDTPETLQKRVMVEAEWQLLPKALAMVCSDEV
mgnify:CR=1 FL=1